MRDYEVLVERLRYYEEHGLCAIGPYEAGEAADAIEELLIMVDQYQQIEKHNIKVIEGLHDAVNLYKEAYIHEHDERIEEIKRYKWISVEKRLPEHGQEVLCACRAGIYEVFKYVDGISGPWYKDSRHVYMKGFVTHWMTLPEPPKEDA